MIRWLGFLFLGLILVGIPIEAVASLSATQGDAWEAERGNQVERSWGMGFTERHHLINAVEARLAEISDQVSELDENPPVASSRAQRELQLALASIRDGVRETRERLTPLRRTTESQFAMAEKSLRQAYRRLEENLAAAPSLQR